MTKSMFLMAVAAILGLCSARLCRGQAEFKLGIEGTPAGDQGFIIDALRPGSSMLSLRNSEGGFSHAEPKDRVLAINQQPFSRELLQAIAADLATNCGIVNLELVDFRTGNTHELSAVLRRNDVNLQLRRGFAELVREEPPNPDAKQFSVGERDGVLVGINLEPSFMPEARTEKPSPLSILIACQTGMDRMRISGAANQFEQMISPSVYARATAILDNALAEVALNPEGEHAQSVAENAHAAVLDEFRVSFQSYAQKHGWGWKEESRRAVAFFRFKPITAPPGLTVEVIPNGARQIPY
jgi:hypothetical protein